MRGCPLLTETVRDNHAFNAARQRGIAHKTIYRGFKSHILSATFRRP